jgi:predicted O-linked N-acetylglucosamine transferase (SPINDLY family)
MLNKAITSYCKVIAMKPDFIEAYNNLGLTLLDLGRLDDAISNFHKALVIKPSFTSAHSNLIFVQNYQPEITLNYLKQIHSEWDKHHGVPLQAEWQGHNNIPDPDRPLRIGFVSPDLGHHPVGYFITNLLEHRRNNIKFICYSSRIPDGLTNRLKAISDQWFDVRGISNEALTQLIRSHQIDILIDLAGHTAKNKSLVFARKPSPVQVSWAGYMGTTGISAIDYLIADYHQAPEGVDKYYTEKLIRLPNGNVSYKTPDYAPIVNKLPFNKNKFITFGCFNNPAKINELVLMTWVKILKAVPDSHLILKYRNMNAGGNRSRILNILSAEGIEETRLKIEGPSKHPELLARYNEIDIALDTFPYSGGLTTCEALWMGIPVVTAPGETFASRHSFHI